jgi:uncharacterized lipoprotein YddW (UPF0748 family)
MKKIVLLSLFIVSFLNLTAQPPKREMRAGWLATVSRIDWPTTPMTTVTAANIAAQKAEFTAILDSVKAANMNAVLFQIRPETDAFYNSAYEPWSANLGGTRGTYPGYDPLAFAIEEAHKRGIELHGWINPYRFETSAGKYSGLPGNYKATHPEWILDYAKYTNGTKTTDGVTILDPGNPAVRKLIKNVIGDILSKYDVDGILFDDYFYAYAGTSSTLDSYSQNLYKPASITLSDWRRNNVNKMVADVYDTIQAVRPSVIFGVAPFGIWTTQTAVATARGLTLPSGITGSDMYEQIYCDPVAWLEQGKVDYISPQLYWTTTSTGQDYKKLCPWWSNVAYKYTKYFYSSMSLTDLTSTYKAPGYSPVVFGLDIPADLPELKLYTRNGGLMTGLTQTEQRIAAAATSFDDSEVGLEIDWNRNSTKNAAPGNVFYSIKNLRTKGNFTRYLREQKFTSLALTPAINWKSHATLTAPTNVIINGNTLNWDLPQSNMRFVIYAVPNAQAGNSSAFTTVTNIIGISYTNEFDLTNYSNKFSTCKFAVSALDRYGNEFTPTYFTSVDTTKSMNDDVRISVSNGTISVYFSGKAVIELFTFSGTLVHSQISTGEYSHKLAHGAYLLRINSKTYKVII